MNWFRNALNTLVFLTFLYLCLTFFQNYNSPENIEKRCMLKFEKDFKNPLGISIEELDRILELADNNYLKCMGIP